MELAPSELDALRSQQPQFCGNWEELARLMAAARTPTQSEVRGNAVREWNAYNTTRINQGRSRSGRVVKVALRLSHRGVDLRGAALTSFCLGYVDLRGANLQNANLSYAMLKGVLLHGADLRGADLSRALLLRANLTGAKLQGAILDQTNLEGADLSEAEFDGTSLARGARLARANFHKTDLRGVDLTGADLRGASLINTDLRGADLSGAKVYGISAWDVQIDEDDAKQRDLIVTPDGEPDATIDRINVAQFYYLIRENKNLRDVIQTIGRRGVLLLGRFTEERKPVLDALRTELRRKNYLPMMFDFEQPDGKTFTDTLLTLAGMSRFVIADLTKPASVPHELQAIIPNFMIPIVPIAERGAAIYSMFRDHFARNPDRVLQVLNYSSIEELLGALQRGIIERADQRSRLLAARAQAGIDELDAAAFAEK